MGGLSVPSSFRLGPYELGERLGAGGMAEVYVARRAGPHGFAKRFAIKRILPQLARDPRFCAMFCDEARICAALSHPNIVQVVDFGEHDGELFMAMEYVDGISGAKLLRTVAARGERFPPGAALFITHEVLRALSFAHEACDDRGRPLGIVHRDVSPGNVLIGRAGEVKLTDFGIVRSAFVDRRTYPGELKGKLGYMSPEQVIGADVDPRSDLFTVGILLAEMLLARPLFPGRNELEILTRIHEADLRVLRRYGQGLPEDLVAVLTQALSGDRQSRFQSAREFADALRVVARRQNIALTEADLVPWLAALGVLRSQSGVHEASSAEPLPGQKAWPARVRAVGRSAPPGARAPAGYSEAPAMPLAEVISPSSPSRYHLRLGAGSLLGPLSLPQLLELAATGRLGPDTPVSEDGNGFRPARQIDALGQLILRPAFRFNRDFEARCLWHDRIDRARLPAWLFELVLSRETGVVVGENGRRQKRVYLSEGAVQFVSSTDRGELLGARLVHAGVVSHEHLAQALALSCDGGHRRLGEVLVELGAIRPLTLLRALVDQLEARFFDLLRWSSGELWFVRGEQSGEDRVRATTSAEQLVARAVRAGYSDQEIVGLLSPFRHCPVARAPGARTTVAELALPAPERRALERCSGAPSLVGLLGDLAAEQVATPEQALRAMFIGLCAGLVVVPGWPRAPE